MSWVLRRQEFPGDARGWAAGEMLPLPAALFSGAASQGAGAAPLGLPSRSQRQQQKPVSWLLLRPRQPLEGVSRLCLGFDFGLR